MPEEPDILDYAQPTPKGWRAAFSKFEMRTRYFVWLTYRRPLKTTEVFNSCWLVFCVMWASAAMALEHDLLLRLFVSAIAALPIVMTGTAIQMLQKKQFRSVLWCVVLMIPTMVVSGTLQITSCPHATYLLVFGKSFPLTPNPCFNNQDRGPWWMRK